MRATSRHPSIRNLDLPAGEGDLRAWRWRAGDGRHDDTELPADIRMTIAQKAFPGRTGGVRPAKRANSEPLETMSQAARDALFDIVSDASASAKARWKAAAKLATYFLPKHPVNKRWRFTADDCGFSINAEIAREHRAIDLELWALKRHPNRDFPEIAQRIRKLQARIDADPSAA